MAPGKEHAMTLSPDVRFHDDGSIDFDHYRRVAARERQEKLRRAYGRFAAAVAKLLSALADRPARPLPRPRAGALTGRQANF
jgi:hypothetical protein